MRPSVTSLSCILIATVIGACGPRGEPPNSGWSGAVDTLASGQVIVRNHGSPVWADRAGWQVIEELRIGRVDGDGPDAFGQLTSLEVDQAGRFWVLEDQAQELRLFDPAGAHVRTIGRRGSGPGEFARAVHVELAPDGLIWVVDPENNRISIFDTAGTYLDARRTAGRILLWPWPGGFDEHYHYYSPLPRAGPDGLSIVHVRHDSQLVPVDTFEMPVAPFRREVVEDAGATITIPFQHVFRSWRSRAGTIWTIHSDEAEYRLTELTRGGDTIRAIGMATTPLPVTQGDLDKAREDLDWFIERGGQVDWSRVPRTKPPVTGTAFLDDERNIWVERVPAEPADGSAYDIFDPEGRYLGIVLLPFVPDRRVPPIIRAGFIYAVTLDELDVPYVVRGRIVRYRATAARSLTLDRPVL